MRLFDFFELLRIRREQVFAILNFLLLLRLQCLRFQQVVLEVCNIAFFKLPLLGLLLEVLFELGVRLQKLFEVRFKTFDHRGQRRFSFFRSRALAA